MKKTLSVVSVLCLLLLMTACGANAAPDDETVVTPSSYEKESPVDSDTSQTPVSTEDSSGTDQRSGAVRGWHDR